tara:strand:- start:2024 stop:2356 length:333 start_codon:yes stop_codon:yes gene_type:complete
MIKKQNLLFICSRNQWRSPTAEAHWKKHPNYNVRSAGTSPNARRTVNSSDIQWADIIFVMERKHKSRLISRFTRIIKYKKVYVLDIPDNYKFMDEALIIELEGAVSLFID